MGQFIFYATQSPVGLNDPCAALLHREVATNADRMGWLALTEYAQIGGYRREARITARDPEEAWHRAHTDHVPTARYVTPIAKNCRGYSSCGDVYEDVGTGALWLCCGEGWREAPDDVAARFKTAVRDASRTPPDSLEGILETLEGWS